ncbi:MAG: hypothetical protein OEM26_15775 [Saprospiraceae bacterium]|nr:hypothetical protein [Saprospiraceae bacterium]
MSEKRKLATILFADIAGYTALMQKDEQQALLFLNRFKEVLEQQTHQHRGEIVQYFGDGCLLAFDSSVHGVECACALQKSFFVQPNIPVRIGMHLGDVVFKDGNVFGDGVNVASRVESLGVPGSVLLSKPIRDQIKNRSEFQLTSLGSFDFKNVEEPMEVFALTNPGLVVPKPNEVTGKLQPAKSQGTLVKIIPVVASLVILVLVGVYGYNSWFTTDSEAGPIAHELRSERIAVVPFENLTTDPALDNFGKIASNFINLALMNIENAEVVSPATVETNLAAFGILPGDPSRSSFNELTGANLVIAGSYFLNENEMTLALQIQNAMTGKLQFALPHISGNQTDKEKIISDATEKVLGYWAARDMVDSRRINLPDLEAYSLFLDRFEIGFGPDDLEAILSLDSNFYLARIEWLNHSRWLLHTSKPDHFRFLDRHLADLTKYERDLYDYVKNLYQGNSLITFKIADKLRKRFPKDFSLNHDAAAVAFDELNNYPLTMQIYAGLPLEEVEVPYVQGTHPRIRNEIISRTILPEYGANDKEPLANLVDLIQWSDPWRFIPSLYAIMTKDEQLYHQILEEDFAAASDPEDTFARLVGRFDWDYRSVFSSPEMNARLIEVARKSLDQYPEGPIQREILSQALRVLDKTPVTLDLKWRNVADPYSPWAPYKRYLYWTALGNIQSGDLNTVHQIIREMESLVTEDLTLAASYAAFPYYHIGCIYNQMGDTENAIIYLRKAKEMGLYAGNYQFNYDKHLESLFDHPEFIEIVTPIWPEEYK